MGTLVARDLFILTSIFRKYKLHNFSRFYDNLYRFHTSNNKLTTVDVIDDFTVQLVKEKTKKWSNLQNKKTEDEDPFHYSSPWNIDLKFKFKNMSNGDKLKIDISNLSIPQIDSLISSALDSDAFYDVEYLIGQCLQNEQCPSVEIILEVMSVYSFNGNIKMVTALQRFYSIYHPELTLANADFNHYLAKAIWMKGNIEKGFKLFISVYTSHPSLRSKVKMMLRYLISDVVSNRSEASVVILKKYSLYFGSHYNDWYPLMIFWECCWLSEWFGDQQLSESLLKESDPLRNFILDKLPVMAFDALRNHQEDAVLRLLQLVLYFDLKHSYSQVIGILFDYRYKQRNFRGCLQIMQNCVSMKIELSPVQHARFMNLLISKGQTSKGHTPPKDREIKYEKTTLPYKF